jgi:hypothetical protein
MSTKLPRKALIAVCSFNGASYPDGHKTGVVSLKPCILTKF